MHSLRKTYWYFTGFLKKHGLTLTGATVLGIILFAVLLPLFTRLPQLKRTQYIGIVGRYDFSTLPLPIQQQISSGLTAVQPDGTAIPDISERWVVEDEGKTYRFMLKPNLRWQDGKQIEGQDISYNFQDTEVFTTDSEIIFKLKEPFAPFPIVVSQPLFRQVKTPYLRFFQRTRIVGNGEFEITKIHYKDGSISELIIDNQVERIVYRFYLSEPRAVTALKRGNVDTLREFSHDAEVDGWPNMQVVQVMNRDQFLGIYFNHNNPLFQKNVRQALNYALPKVEGDERALGPISPNSWAYLESVKPYHLDVQRGIERLLDEIPAQPISFTLTTTARFQPDAEEIKQVWEKFGEQAVVACQGSSAIRTKSDCERLKISVTVSVTNFPDTSNYDALLIGEKVPVDPDQYGLWHSTQNTNLTHYQNPRIDALLENGRKTTDQSERRAIYQEFQQFLLEDAPVVFLRYLPTYTISRK